MLLKKKAFEPTSDFRLRAGNEAEKQMAFQLDRRFEDADDVFLIHDLRIEHGHHAFQIDHLVVNRYGISLVESKSIHTKVTITRHDERREHWSREFNGKEEGIPSPVRQVQEQARLLQEFLIDNREQILGKLLFVLQKGYGNCPFDTYVGVSTSAIFNLSPGTPLPKHVYKADEVAPEIARILKERKKSDTLLNLNPLAPLPWEMSLEEARKTAEFLLANNRPLAAKRDAPRIEAPARSFYGGTDHPIPRVEMPRAPYKRGDTCPSCGKLPVALATGGPAKADGSREKYWACVGNRDHSCTWKVACEEPAQMPARAVEAFAPTPLVPPVPPAPQPAALQAVAVEPPPGSSPGYFCFACRSAIPREVGKFCWDHPKRFGGKAYCRSCQARFPRI